jgi:hypothetical protein
MAYRRIDKDEAVQPPKKRPCLKKKNFNTPQAKQFLSRTKRGAKADAPAPLVN